MKKIVYISLSLLAAAACRSQMDEEPFLHAITFVSSVDATKVVPVTTSNIGDLDVMVMRAGTDNLYFADVAARGESGLFDFSAPRYWLPGAALDFYSVAQSASVSNFSVSNGAVEFDYDATVAESDVVTAVTRDCRYTKDNRGVVPMRFRHALARVEFAVAYETDADGNKVSKISDGIYFTELALNGMATTGHCSVLDGTASWTCGQIRDWTVRDFTSEGAEGLYVGRDIFAGDCINTQDRSKSFFVIPGQTLRKVRISFVEGRPQPYEQEINVPQTLIEPGMCYVFDLAIKSNFVSLTGTRITPWMSGDSQEITMQ